jgi:predicted nucleic acid-binding protein
MKAVSDSTVLIGLAKIENKEIQADLVLLDEEKARKSALRAGFKVMGLIGILIVAKRIGLITDIGTHIEKLQKEKFRLSEKIVNMALKQAGELPKLFC